MVVLIDEPIDYELVGCCYSASMTKAIDKVAMFRFAIMTTMEQLIARDF